MLLNYLIGRTRSEIYEQIILVVNTPKQIGGKWDLCDGCPDAILNRGDLVPSCLLERIKQGENIGIK